MSSVVISGDTSGAITLAAPSVAGTNTITLPAQTGSVVLGGPYFSAYPNVSQTISSSTGTILAYNTKIADNNTCYNNTSGTVTLNGISVPAYSFAPNVAGYYQVSVTAAIYGQTLSVGYIAIYIQKNGTAYGANLIPLIGNIETIPSASCLIYLNGTSDYLNIKGYQTYGSSLTMDAGTFCNFSAIYVRSA